METRSDERVAETDRACPCIPRYRAFLPAHQTNGGGNEAPSEPWHGAVRSGSGEGALSETGEPNEECEQVEAINGSEHLDELPQDDEIWATMREMTLSAAGDGEITIDMLRDAEQLVYCLGPNG